MKLIYEDKKRVMTTALWQETDMVHFPTPHPIFSCERNADGYVLAQCCSLYTIYVRKGDAWTYSPSS